MNFTTNFISVLKDLIIIVATASGAIVAFLGLQTWKSKLKWETEYNLARRLIKASLRVREAIKVVRNPFIPLTETEAALEKFADKKAEVDPTRVTYSVRWQEINKAMTDLDLEVLEAEAVWGHKATIIFQPLRDCVKALWLALMLYLDFRSDPDTWRELYKSKKPDDVIYETHNDDKFSKEVDTALSKIELVLGKYLKF